MSRSTHRGVVVFLFPALRPASVGWLRPPFPSSRLLSSHVFPPTLPQDRDKVRVVGEDMRKKREEGNKRQHWREPRGFFLLYPLDGGFPLRGWVLIFPYQPLEGKPPKGWNKRKKETPWAELSGHFLRPCAKREEENTANFQNECILVG